MNYSSKLGGLKRTRWDNKTTRQKQEILKSHYETLGYSIPKYLDGNKLNEKQLGQALNKITKGYVSRTTPPQAKVNPETTYNNTLKKFNNKIEGLETTLKEKGFGELEIDYIKGKEIFLPNLRKKSFHSDLIDLHVIRKQVFSSKKAMIEETKRIKQEIKNLNKRIKEGDFFNTQSNNYAFNDMLNNSSFDGFNEDDLTYLRNHYNALSPFGKEVFMKIRFSELRDKYKYLFENEEYEQGDVSKLFNGLLYGIKNTHKTLTGEELLISKSGKKY